MALRTAKAANTAALQICMESADFAGILPLVMLSWAGAAQLPSSWHQGHCADLIRKLPAQK